MVGSGWKDGALHDLVTRGARFGLTLLLVVPNLNRNRLPTAPIMRLVPFVTVITLAAAFALAGGGSARAEQPVPLWLPWEGGALWTYTQGPHGDLAEALDFQPPDAGGQPCESFVSSFWVTASADGTAVTRANGVEVQHNGGFSTGYYHLDNVQVEDGQQVSAGQRLGTPSCCPDGEVQGCWATGPHVHFYTWYSGARQGAYGLNLGGWLVAGDGCLVRNEERVCADSRIVSNTPRSLDGSPTSRADIVLLLDTSGGARSQPELIDAARTLLQALRSDDSVAIVSFDSAAGVPMEFGPAFQRSLIDRRLLKAMHGAGISESANLRAGLGRSCSEILDHGTAPSKAIVLLSGGKHSTGSTSAAQRCLMSSGVPVYAYSSGDSSAALARIARATGGEYRPLAEVSNTYCEFRRIRSLASGDPPGRCSAYQLATGDVLLLPFNIPANQDEATLEVQWRVASGDAVPGGITPRIHGPGGGIIKLPLSGITVEERDGAVVFKIVRPLAGAWRLSVSGENLPPEGVYVTFSGKTVPQAPPAPSEMPSPSAGPTDPPTDSATPTPGDSRTPTPVPTKEPRPTAEPQPTPPSLETPPVND